MPKSPKMGRRGGYYEGANLSAVFFGSETDTLFGRGKQKCGTSDGRHPPPPPPSSARHHLLPRKKESGEEENENKRRGAWGIFSAPPTHPSLSPISLSMQFHLSFFLFAQMCGRLGDRFSPLSLSQARSSICQLWSHCFSGIGGEEEEEEEGFWGSAHTCPISRMLSFEERWEGKKSQLEAEAAHFSFSFFLYVGGGAKAKACGKMYARRKGQRERKIKAFSSRLRLLAHFSDVG